MNIGQGDYEASSLPHENGRTIRILPGVDKVVPLSWGSATEIVLPPTEACCEICQEAGRKCNDADFEGTIQIGNLSSIVQKKKSCASCKDVAGLISVHLDSDYLESVQLRIRRPDRLRFQCLIERGPYNITQANLVPLLSPNDYAKLPDTEDDYGRWYDPNHVDISVVEEWIRRCEHNHAGCAIPQSLENPNKMSLLLVDVTKDCLTWMPMTEVDYVALSYVWGGAPTTKTTSKNVDVLRQQGSLSPITGGFVVPNTIRDAMKLTSDLGVRWLWVDCLSIIQDDENINHYLNAMGIIYANAYITVIVANSSTANDGIRGVSFALREAPSGLVRFPGFAMKASNYIPDVSREQHLSSTPWAQRGWTFQEGFFSNRVLIFNGTMSWLCQNAYREEGGTNRLKRGPDGRRPMSATFPHLCQLTQTPGLSDYLRPQRIDSSRFAGDWAHYASLVQTFNTREISFEKDILDAFSGILWVFSIRNDTRPIGFMHGIPLQLMNVGLLWQPSPYTMLRRRVHEVEDPEWGLINHLPSWSWVGWQGGVDLTPWEKYEPNHPENPKPIISLHAPCNRCGQWTPIGRTCCNPRPGGILHSYTSPLLSFTAEHSRFRMQRRGNGDSFITSSSADPIGRLRHDTGRGSYYGHARDIILPSGEEPDGTVFDFVAIASGSCTNSHFWDMHAPLTPLPLYGRSLGRDGIFDDVHFYFVLCVKWEGEIATRLGLGAVLRKYWNRYKEQTEVDVVLG